MPLIIVICSAGQAPSFRTEVEVTPAEDSIGERLFLDTRFAQYFATHTTGVNQPLAVGDPVVQQVNTLNGVLPGPFAGQSINCRSCHFVTEFQGVSGAGNRTYSDFTARSPIPLPMNGFTDTPRNSMHMVGSLQPHPGPVFLHFDGEFATPEDLVKARLRVATSAGLPPNFNRRWRRSHSSSAKTMVPISWQKIGPMAFRTASCSQAQTRELRPTC